MPDAGAALALRLVKPHEVLTGPLLKFVQVALDGIPSFYCVNCTAQLCIICKLAEGYTTKKWKMVFVTVCWVFKIRGALLSACLVYINPFQDNS